MKSKTNPLLLPLLPFIVKHLKSHHTCYCQFLSSFFLFLLIPDLNPSPSTTTALVKVTNDLSTGLMVRLQ